MSSIQILLLIVVIWCACLACFVLGFRLGRNAAADLRDPDDDALLRHIRTSSQRHREFMEE